MGLSPPLDPGKEANKDRKEDNWKTKIRPQGQRSNQDIKGSRSYPYHIWSSVVHGYTDQQ